MLIAVSVAAILVLMIYVFMQQPQFGARTSGERLKRIESSPNFREGQFRNQSHTPSFTEGANMLTIMYKFFFQKNKRGTPDGPLPSRKTDLLGLAPEEDILVWFGHSSYFMQINRKKFLVDPVHFGHASPVKFTTKSFKGSDVYKVDEIPQIDYLVITHDHWDHLDYETLKALKPRVGKIITALGVGAHLERWGFDSNCIYELDWNEKLVLEKEFEVVALPARHFSGRGFKRNQTLWMSLALTTPGKKIYIGGDSGYDNHFASIGTDYGPFDLAILENGQYNNYWKHIHMMPEEVVQAAVDLRAKKFLPVHWSKFSLSLHSWDEPIIRVVDEAEKKGAEAVYPLIGEKMLLNNYHSREKWWETVALIVLMNNFGQV